MSGFFLGGNMAASLLKVSFEDGSMPCSSPSMHLFALLTSPVVTCLLASVIQLLPAVFFFRLVPLDGLDFANRARWRHLVSLQTTSISPASILLRRSSSTLVCCRIFPFGSDTWRHITGRIMLQAQAKCCFPSSSSAHCRV